MHDQPAPDRLAQLRFLERVQQADLARTRRWIAAEECRQQDRQRSAARRPPAPDWLIDHGLNRNAPPLAVHAGGCGMVGKRARPVTQDTARSALTEGVPACGHCRPDTELGGHHLARRRTRHLDMNARPPCPREPGRAVVGLRGVSPPWWRVWQQTKPYPRQTRPVRLSTDMFSDATVTRSRRTLPTPRMPEARPPPSLLVPGTGAEGGAPGRDSQCCPMSIESDPQVAPSGVRPIAPEERALPRKPAPPGCQTCVCPVPPAGRSRWHGADGTLTPMSITQNATTQAVWSR
ncbi:DUF6233 domain-containing protein [Streptomyces sp. NPDC004376]